jgi:DNA-binding XRE family transcriptional regulator
MMRASSAPFGRGSKNQKFSLPFLFSSAGGVGGADKKWKGNFWFCFAVIINIVYPILGLYHKRIYDCKCMSKSVYSKDYKDIIERLKTARIEAGLAQQEVAIKLGKPQSFISKIESGERRLDVAEIKKFAVIYKKDISFFIK